MCLVISEKPSVAQSIAKVIGAYKKEDGYLSGRDCLVSWCLGHLAEYAMPEAYDEKYGIWSFEDLPIIPDKWKLEVAKDKKTQFTVLKKLLTRRDLEYVVNACDAGREGELIFKRVYDLSGSSIPIKRLWISSMEDKAILDGFAHLKSGDEYKNLADASVCRAQADWLVGMNATRAYTKTYNHRLTVGRVQTPTLAMLVDRDEEIRNFQKKQYFIVHIQTDDLDAVSAHLDDRQEAERIANLCDGKAASVQTVKKETKAVKPPKLYDLTTLQREANRLFGLTAKQTLDIAQSLYEKKLITYPRTDSQYLTEDMEESVNGIIVTLKSTLPFIYDNSFPFDLKRVLNSKKVSDHHAIIPTAEIGKVKESDLRHEEWIILMMVANRLLSATGDKYQYLVVKAEITCCGQLFTITGRTVTSPGWRICEEAMKRYFKTDEDKDDDEESASIPDLTEGQNISKVKGRVTEHWTKPPKAYTEDSLLAAMERAGNADMDEDVERKGLGTPATRASIIEKLISSGYAARKKRQIVATEGGAKMTALMPDYLKSAQMTADWENRLLQMERGETSGEIFMKDIYTLIDNILVSCKEVPEDMRKRYSGLDSRGKEEIGKCPVCGSAVLEGNKKFYCTNRDCNFTLWKETRFLSSMKKTISKKMAVDLLSKGKIHVKDFVSVKTGKPFEADLLMNVDDGRVSFSLEFPQREPNSKRKE